MTETGSCSVDISLAKTLADIEKHNTKLKRILVIFFIVLSFLKNSSIVSRHIFKALDMLIASKFFIFYESSK